MTQKLANVYCPLTDIQLKIFPEYKDAVKISSNKSRELSSYLEINPFISVYKLFISNLTVQLFIDISTSETDAYIYEKGDNS